jgi:ABC-type transporter Mla subunit MlaD
VRSVDTMMASLAAASSQQASSAQTLSEALSQVQEFMAAGVHSAQTTAHACEALTAEAAGLDTSFDALGALLGQGARPASPAPASTTAVRRVPVRKAA